MGYAGCRNCFHGQASGMLNGEVGTNIKTAYLDEELPIKTPDLKNVDNALVVFHLMGEHTTYADRYPAVYQKFDEAGTKRDEYDNAVLIRTLF